MLKYIVHLCFALFAHASAAKNNVCNNLYSYKYIETSEDCWHNPDVGKSAIELIGDQQLQYENHTVTTEDGYILTMFRLYKNNYGNKVVYLEPGILTDASIFMQLGRKKSIAFALVDNGYDVWLGNYRGSTYSRLHTNESISEEDYWNFSFHEMGVYDIPPTLEYIKERTKSQVLYVGYSMGTTMGFIYASMKPEHASEHLMGMVAISPVVFFERDIILRLVGYAFTALTDYIHSAGRHSVNDYNTLTPILEGYCTQYPRVYLCNLILSLIAGFTDIQSADKMPVILRALKPSSTKSIRHFAQGILDKSAGFSFYDYGFDVNQYVYGTSEPPPYPLTNFKLPLRIFYGTSDIFVTDQTVRKLTDTLQLAESVEIYKYPMNGNVRSNHLDYFFGDDVYLYELVEKFIKTVNNLFKINDNS